ncbi:MAG TPA: xanthine dehydrogenase family protein molybdopterin-binding subunit [Xanthobacteraceae bacterium]|jgi:carbon-monoxide dehydrogenase large subunit|nr:xanthine dehydrogenase family protein molybdopterin-binding subunit [Xanthobacteraceae bacterium]
MSGLSDIHARPKIIGARIKRVEDPRLLTGRGRFTDEIAPQGALHVAFRRSDQSHARISSIDCDAARKAPGVIAVLTAEDLSDEVRPLVATSRMKNYYATPILPLAHGKVRYVGEPVVGVIAENRYQAEDAIELIAIDYEPLPSVIDPEAAVQEGAPLLHDEAGTNVIVAREFKRGDVEAALASAAVRVGGRFRMHRKTTVAMETRACSAQYDAQAGAIILHSATQVPGIVRDALALALDIPADRLRVVAPDVGGGFGGKGSLYPEEIFVAAAARRLQRPVKWTCDRMEDLIASSQGFDEIVDAELGLDSDGRIVALVADVIGDIGAYSIYPWTAALEPVQVVSFLPGPYRIEHYRGRVRGVVTSKAPTGPYRGVGRPISTFAMERLVDMAAMKLNLDAKEIRLRNLVVGAEFPYKAASGIVWDQSGFQECLNIACETVGYDALRAKQAAARKEGRWLGIGIASYAELTGIGSRIPVAPGMPINTGTETADIRVEVDGRVTAAFGVASHGQGLETTLAQVIAEHLGVRVDDVRVIHGDTAVANGGTGTYASRSMVLAGGAATLASQAVRDKVLNAASYLLEAATTDLIAEDGRITVAGTDRFITFADVANAVNTPDALPPDAQDALAATMTYDPIFGTTTAATHIAAVEIDMQTFQVRIDAFAVAEDCGKLVNPLIVDGQVHGGVAQGVGAALFEEVMYDAQGQIMTASLVDYLVPSSMEIPPMLVAHLESVSPTTLGGFRGMGEGGTIGAPAAIANALADALSPLGIEINELPATPERLFCLIEAARAKTG